MNAHQANRASAIIQPAEPARDIPCLAGGCDGFDFDQRVFGQTCDLDGGAGGRVMWEESGVDGVHGGEIVHVFEEDGCFDDVTETAVAGVEDGLQVFERLGGLFGDAAGHEGRSGGIDGKLAAGEDEVAGGQADGLGVRANGGGGGVGGDMFHEKRWASGLAAGGSGGSGFFFERAEALH